MYYTINASLFIFYNLYDLISYGVKKYISIWFRFITVICMGVGLFATTACNRYAIHAMRKNTHQIQTDTSKAPPANSDFLQVTDMIVFYKEACEAIKTHHFNKLKRLLKEIKSPKKEIFDDVLYLITGYKVGKKCKKQYPREALLAQVITSYEGELSETYTYTNESLDILFRTIKNYRFGLKEAFLQKHGDDENTLIHLGVNTANLAIVKCLVSWLKQGVNNDPYQLIRICSIPNRLGITPLSMVAQAMYDAPLACDGHTYDAASETSETYDYECLCDYETEKRVAREDIVLYLITLGIPWFENTGAEIGSLIHYFNRYDAKYFLIKMIEGMQQRPINKHMPEDLVFLSNKESNSLLFYAVLYRNYELTEYLLASGACPMQANKAGCSPVLLAIAFRDIKMITYLCKSKCILERICNINKQHSNGLTALDVAKSWNSCGLYPDLKAYCNKFEEKYQRQIIYNEWNWQPNDQIVQLISYLYNFFRGIRVNYSYRKRKRDSRDFRSTFQLPISLVSNSWGIGG